MNNATNTSRPIMKTRVSASGFIGQTVAIIIVAITVIGLSIYLLTIPTYGLPIAIALYCFLAFYFLMSVINLIALLFSKATLTGIGIDGKVFLGSYHLTFDQIIRVELIGKVIRFHVRVAPGAKPKFYQVVNVANAKEFYNAYIAYVNGQG